VLVGSEHWQGMLEWTRARLLGRRLVSPEDVELLHLSDEPVEVVRFIVGRYRRKCAEVGSQLLEAKP
jgi:predicted Rossmann-fold nucleotide-binding protein